NDIKFLWCNETRNPNPFKGIEGLGKYWDQANSTDEWKAPDGMFWICGKRAYTELPKDWKGSCAIEVIQPGFFLLPLTQGAKLGIPV
ncbi:ENR1 protein, partial [Eurystomus gularis]|nr:ENR1 protein [Eurystomus gularis]